jgi:hypothetical protein
MIVSPSSIGLQPPPFACRKAFTVGKAKRHLEKLAVKSGKLWIALGIHIARLENDLISGQLNVADDALEQRFSLERHKWVQ